MRKFYVFVLIPLLMALFNIDSSYAAPPLNDRTQHTPLSLMPETLVPSFGIKVAAIWWLPDYLGSNSGRGTTDTGGGDNPEIIGKCGTYGMVESCGAPKVSTGTAHPVSGLTCQKSCICPAEYQYTSSNCTGSKMLSGSTCDEKYNDCVCRAEFQYNSSNCSGEKEPSGASCDGYYNDCTIRPECAVTSKSCTYGCDSYNSCGKCIECESAPSCSPSSYSWCSYHELCHGDCCTDGTYKSCDTRCGGSGCSSSVIPDTDSSSENTDTENSDNNTDNNSTSSDNSGSTTPSCRCIFGRTSCPASHPYSQDVTRSEDTCSACYYCGKGYITVTEEVTYSCAQNPYHSFPLFQFGTRPHQRCSTGESAYDVYTSHNDYKSFDTLEECQNAEAAFNAEANPTGEVCGDIIG